MNRDDQQTGLMQGLSVLRMAIGVSALIAPRLLAQQFAGIQATPQAKFVARLVGSRDLALGYLTLDALQNQDRPVRLLEINMMVDGLDGIAGLLAFRRLPRLGRWVTALGALGAVTVAARERAALRT